MTQRSRNRTVREGPEIQDGVTESLRRYPLCKSMRVRQVPGPGHKAPRQTGNPRWQEKSRRSEVKARQVLAKVYEPRRLQVAWQKVKRNAGAAGIDRMTVEEFAQREEVLLALIHDKLKSVS